MNEHEYQYVHFDVYCNLCKHKMTLEIKEPCNECLDNPTNLYSHKPVNFEGVKKWLITSL